MAEGWRKGGGRVEEGWKGEERRKGGGVEEDGRHHRHYCYVAILAQDHIIVNVRLPLLWSRSRGDNVLMIYEF